MTHGRARAVSRVAQMARHSGAAGPAAGRCGHGQGVRELGEEIRRPHRRARSISSPAPIRASASRTIRRCSPPSTATTTWCSSPTTPSISPARCPTSTVRARPVVGSIDLEPVAWHWTWERNGAPQVNSRFQQLTGGRRMESADWAAWIAVKMVVQATLRTRSAEFEQQREFILGDNGFDGNKGLAVSVRPWDQQLRQAVLLATPYAVVAQRAGRGLSAPDQRARHARRRRAGNAVPAEQVAAMQTRPRRPRAARRHHARDRQVRAAARAAAVGAGAPADVARGVRRRLLQRVRRLDHPALQDLHHLPGLHRAGAARHHPAVPRHAVLALDGLRPRDGRDAAPAHRAAAALGAARLQAHRRHGAVGDHLLRVSRWSASCST